MTYPEPGLSRTIDTPSTLPLGLAALTLLAALAGCDVTGGGGLRVDDDIPPSEAFDAAMGAWSPDGRMIVFSHDDGARDAVSRFDELWVADLEGRRRWHVLPGRALNAAWSPDGRALAFNSASDPEHLFRADTTGEGLAALTGPGSPNPSWGYAIAGAWSPDGTRLAFTVVAGEPRGVAVMGPDGGDPEIVVPYGIAPAWLPDGSGLVYLNWDRTLPVSRRLQVHRARADGTGVVRLTDIPESWHLHGPVVSPDGRRIAFGGPGRRTPSEVWVMAADGSGLRQATEGEGLVDRLEWHPDSRRLLFGRAVPNGPRRLYVLDVETGEVEPVFPEGQVWVGR